MLGIPREVTDDMLQDPVYIELVKMERLMDEKLTLCPRPVQELKQCGCKDPETGEDLRHYMTMEGLCGGEAFPILRPIGKSHEAARDAFWYLGEWSSWDWSLETAKDGLKWEKMRRINGKQVRGAVFGLRLKTAEAAAATSGGITPSTLLVPFHRHAYHITTSILHLPPPTREYLSALKVMPWTSMEPQQQQLRMVSTLVKATV